MFIYFWEADSVYDEASSMEELNLKNWYVFFNLSQITNDIETCNIFQIILLWNHFPHIFKHFLKLNFDFFGLLVFEFHIQICPKVIQMED